MVKLNLPRIYIDANVLISAILESDPVWKRNNPNEYNRRRDYIDTSYKIYDRWKPQNLKTSPFAVGEFISKGQTPQLEGKTYDEMLDIVNRSILSKCQIVYSNLKFPKLIRINEEWKKFWILAEAEGEVPIDGTPTKIKRVLGIGLE